jgi:hypothetical protein
MRRRVCGTRSTVAMLASACVGVGCSSANGGRPVVVTTSAVSTSTATRLEITGVQDTTFSIAVRNVEWVTPGMSGIVVDPTKRDVLVARFRVVQRGVTEATAVVTGQTTKVTAEQAALLQAPAPRVESKKAFWSGVGLGLLFGSVVGSLIGIVSR